MMILVTTVHSANKMGLGPPGFWPSFEQILGLSARRSLQCMTLDSQWQQHIKLE